MTLSPAETTPGSCLRDLKIEVQIGRKVKVKIKMPTKLIPRRGRRLGRWILKERSSSCCSVSRAADPAYSQPQQPNHRCGKLVIFFFFLFWGTECHCVALAGLELTEIHLPTSAF